MKHIKTFNLFEGKTFKATKKPFEKQDWDEDKKEAFRKKIEDIIKSKDCKVKQVGDDFEIHCNGDHIGQVMFRNNYVGVKEVGVKFVDELKYTELGKIKEKVLDIIKSCKFKKLGDKLKKDPS